MTLLCLFSEIAQLERQNAKRRHFLEAPRSASMVEKVQGWIAAAEGRIRYLRQQRCSCLDCNHERRD